MHETARGEEYGPGHLTFDCPWCGAISQSPFHAELYLLCVP